MEKNYLLTIRGMHCSGCKNLITMSLEDEGMASVQVDEKAGNAMFSTAQGLDAVREIVDRIFKDLTDYTYTDLTITT